MVGKSEDKNVSPSHQLSIVKIASAVLSVATALNGIVTRCPKTGVEGVGDQRDREEVHHVLPHVEDVPPAQVSGDDCGERAGRRGKSAARFNASRRRPERD